MSEDFVEATFNKLCAKIRQFENENKELAEKCRGIEFLVTRVHFWNRDLKNVLRHIHNSSRCDFLWKNVSKISFSFGKYGNKRPELKIKFEGNAENYGWRELGHFMHSYYDENEFYFGTFWNGGLAKSIRVNTDAIMFLSWIVGNLPTWKQRLVNHVNLIEKLEKQKHDAEITLCLHVNELLNK